MTNTTLLMIKKLFLSFVWVFAIITLSYSQVYTGSAAQQLVSGAEKVWIKENAAFPSYIAFKPGNEIKQDDLLLWLYKFYNLSEGSGIKAINTEQTGEKTHTRYKLTYQGKELFDQMIVVHSMSGLIYAINGYINPDVTPENNISLHEQAALAYALNHIDADEYKWEMPSEEAHIKAETGDAHATYFPKGEILLYKPKGAFNYHYVYKFNIYANRPLYRAEVFVDAASGTVLFENLLIHPADVNGTAVTKYSGTRTIVTDSTGTTYRLREYTRGNGIETYDMNRGTSYGSAVDFTDADNYWNNFNSNLDEVATDAHWGTEMTYDYYYLRYNRNSINNNGFALKSYVHYDNNYVNAFWDGQRMTYGDGNGGSITPLTAIDITAHEITHGLTSYTANLVYQDESGALNEAFSDIFGTAVEWYAKPSGANWTMGENIGMTLRSMANPNLYGDPKCYHGNHWYFGTGDNGGVHTNCGALNYWFYLLSEGGSGINDNNDTFSVSGISIDSAGAIAYRMLTTYLTNSSQYIDARFYAIQSAIDLFGPCSPQVEATTNAMYAIGVGNPYVHGVVSDFLADNTTFCAPPATVNFSNQSTNSIALVWDFGDSTTSTATNPTHTYNNYGDYTVTLHVSGGSCGQDTAVKIDYINIDPSNPCIYNMPESGSSLITTCDGILYDSGGNQVYQNNTNTITTIAPPGAMSITLNFQSFSFESGYDFLYIYDGSSTTAPLIGTYDGNTLPNGGVITSSGGSITLRQSTDPYLQEDGFMLNWTCVYPSAPPVADFRASDTASCDGKISFIDMSTNGPVSWVWDFGDGTTSSYPAPTHIYQNNGVYTVSLITSNAFGTDTVQKTNFITINKPNIPVVKPALMCNSGQASMIADNPNGDVYWYTTSVGGTPIHIGDTFQTPVLTQTTTYYAQEVIQKTPVFGAKPDNSGGGAYFTSSAQHGIYFNTYEPVTLKSVLVYAGTSGNRTIQLQNQNGIVIESKTVSIPQGTSRITLDFNIPVGSEYLLAGPLSPNLYRNSSGLSYPYLVGNLVSITKSTATSDPTGYYYYFYDWEVEKLPCRSPRKAATAFVSPAAPVASFTYTQSQNAVSFTNTTVNPAVNSWNFGDGNFSIFDNPSHNYSYIGLFDVTLTAENGCGIDSTTQQVNVTTIGLEDTEKSDILQVYPNPTKGSVTVKHNTATLIRPADITVVDLTGRIIYYQFMNIDNNSFELNLAGNSSGLYTIIIRNKAFSHQAKVSLLQ